MASLTSNINLYKTGVLVSRARALPREQAKAFTDYGYSAGHEFTIDRRGAMLKTARTINLGGEQHELKLRDKSNKQVLVYADDVSIIDSSFDLLHKNSTALNTEAKELVSMFLIESYQEKGNVLSEDDVYSKIPAKIRPYYNSIYYRSGIKHMHAMHDYLKNQKGLTYERQQQGQKSKNIYAAVKKYGGPQADNWNPGDVWVFDKNVKVVGDVIKPTNNLTSLNENLRRVFYDNLVMGVSLKQVEDTVSSSKTSVVDIKGGTKEFLELNDMMFTNANLSETLKNVNIETKSGFFVRCAYKGGAQDFSISVEGKIAGRDRSLGSADASVLKDMFAQKYGYQLRSGSVANLENDERLMVDELEQIMRAYPKEKITASGLSETQILRLFTDGDDLLKKRMVNLMSYLYAFLVVPKNEKQEKEIFFSTYLLSMKLTDRSSVYLLLD